MMDLKDESNESREPKLEIWDNSNRARYVLIAFSIFIILNIVGLISSYFEYLLLDKMNQGSLVSEDEILYNDLRQGIIGITQMIIYILTIVFFLNWFRRAYGNLHRIGISLNDKESMAIWYWFIPIVFLFKPVQIMREIWTKTLDKINTFNSNFRYSSGYLIISLWWALFVFSNVIGKYILKSLFKEDSIDQLMDGSILMMVSSCFEIPEALLVMLIVYRISILESTLAQWIHQEGGDIIQK